MEVVELRDIGVVDVSVLFKVYSGSHMSYRKVRSRQAKYVIHAHTHTPPVVQY
jgi:hypothetical protein